MKPILAAAAICLVALPASAQDSPGWSDFVSPSRVLGAMVQYGVVALRTQMDFTYGGLTLDPVENRATLHDVVMRPAVGPSGACRITVDRVTLKGSPLSELTALRVNVGLAGMDLSAACLPPEMRAGLAVLQLSEISVPQTAFDLRYDLPSGRADLLANATIDGVGAVALDARFDYLAAGPGKRFGGDPEPIARLSSAQVQVEDGGAWARLSPLIPAEFTDPANGPARVGQLLRMQRGEVLGPSAPAEAGPAYDALVTSLEGALTEFLAAPSRLVVETGFDPATPVSLAFDDYDRRPEQLLADLRPVVSVRPVPRMQVPPLAQLALALDSPDQVSPEDRRALGLALLTGEGAPRNRAAGLALLSTLDDADGSAAMAMARALARDQPEAAYSAALTASRAGAVGASALLDDLETRLPPGALFRLQPGLDGLDPARMPSTVAALRDRAAGLFDGRDGRSYVQAAYWARLAAAAGDRAASRLLDDIADRMAALGLSAEWQEEDAKTADRALQDWVALDLPRTLGAAPSR
jgi:hypothetical protein